MAFVSLCTILAAIIIQNEASRILAVFPTPSISHQVVFRPLILELVNRGHEVTLLTTDPIFKKGDGPANLTEVDMHDLSYQAYKDVVPHNDLVQGKKEDLKEQMAHFYEMIRILICKQFTLEETQRLLKDKSETFDLLMLEAYISPLLGLTHAFKNVPVILVSSFGPVTDNLRILGAPMHPLVYPSSLQQKIYNQTIWDKMWELYNFYRIEKMIEENEYRFKEIWQQIINDDVPDISELKNNVDMLFLNVHPVWAMNRPVPPNVIYMGGLHQNPEKELPSDLKKYLDSSNNGVIYVSFGTNVRPEVLQKGKIKSMISVFSKLPYDILWKWNEDNLPGKTDNIKISKWLPQSDLLRHPKIKLFITQGGLQSTDEAITAGVPLVGIPMLGDQWFNVDQYVHFGIGAHVDMDTISEESLGNAVQTVLKDKSYRDNIIRLRSIMRDQPQTPLERATWWTEYVLRHNGAKHLKPASANMPYTEYYEIKLICLLLIGILSTITLFVSFVYYLYNLLNRTTVMVKAKSN